MTRRSERQEIAAAVAASLEVVQPTSSTKHTDGNTLNNDNASKLSEDATCAPPKDNTNVSDIEEQPAVELWCAKLKVLAESLEKTAASTPTEDIANYSDSEEQATPIVESWYNKVKALAKPFEKTRSAKVSPVKVRSTPISKVRKRCASTVLRKRKQQTQVTAGPVSKKTSVKTPRRITPTSAETPPSHYLDPDLLRLSQSLVARLPIDSKPLPHGQPEVWATDRQELCETLPYYKSHHGGCYMNQGTVYSFMLDGDGGDGEFMDQDVVIIRAGGDKEADDAGCRVQCRDQLLSHNQPQAVLNSIKHQNPIVIICGNRNASVQTRMPHRYCVLDWFKPTHVWAERVYGSKDKIYTSIKYRFERLNRTRPAWYAPTSTAAFTTTSQDCAQTCEVCGQASSTVFLLGWMCLNHDCSSFWTTENGRRVTSYKLDYHPTFLTHTTKWENEEPPFALRPDVPQLGKQFGDTLQYISTRGIVCPDCGRCNARYLWAGWRCATTGCSWSLDAERQVVLPSNLSHDAWNISGSSITKNVVKPVLHTTTRHTHGYKVTAYTIPGIQGRIIHARAGLKVIQETGGPDDMFRALQEHDAGLIRRPFEHDTHVGKKKHKQAAADGMTLCNTPVPEDVIEQLTPASTGEGMQVATPEDNSRSRGAAGSLTVEGVGGARMNSFSANFGMPYKFIAVGASQPFDTAPWPIRACRSRLNWAYRTILGERVDFNELLLIAYLERQKIAYHDDGETGLGPVVASLSLGAAATMNFRIKGKYFSGVSKTGVFTMEHPLPLATLRASYHGKDRPDTERHQARVEAFHELEDMRMQRSPGLAHRAKEVAAEQKLNFRNAQPLVSLHLTHGDIVIMQGAQLQTFMEHGVEPQGCLRFAMTCRQILPHHLMPAQMPPYAVGSDDFGYDGEQIRGESDAVTLQW